MSSPDKNREAQRYERVREKWTGPDKFVDRLFPPPEGEMLRAVMERFGSMEKWREHRDAIVDMYRILADRIFETVRKRMEADLQLRGQTNLKLQELEAHLEDHLGTVVHVGEAIKMRENPYSDKPKGEVFHPAEILAFRESLDRLMQVPIDELVDMMFENQPFVQMLIEERDLPGHKKEVGGLLDPDNPHYQHNLVHLMNFCLGRTSAAERKEGLKEKSEFRQLAERSIWQETIRGLDFQQKRDLIVTFLKETDPETTRNFISECIILGIMTRREALHMYAERNPAPDVQASPNAALFAKLGEDFEKFTDDAVKGKEFLRKKIQEEAKRIATFQPQIQNAAAHFMTFNKLGAETVARCAMLSAVFNFVLTVSDSLTQRAANESWGAAFAKGVGKGLTNKMVIAAAATGVAMSTVLYDWATPIAYGPDSAEKTRLREHERDRFIHEIADNHPALLEHFADNYDGLQKKVERNAQDDNKREKSAQFFGLLMEDIPMTPEQAGKFGYPDVETARAATINLFGAFSRSLQIKNKRELARYLKKHQLTGVIV